jgi:hypothetical protein
MIFRLQPGDRVLIGGSDIACAGATSTKVNKKTIDCYPANAQLDQIPRSWGFYLSSDLVALFQGKIIKLIQRVQP